MDPMKRQKLEAAGWQVGTAEEFLALAPEEARYVELRLRLGDAVRHLRKNQRLSQVQLAERMHSSQSRIAKAEAADRSVSIDLLIRSLLALGISDQDLARYVSGQ